MATLTMTGHLFKWIGTYDERILASDAGFIWDRHEKNWKTVDITKALVLKQYADESTAKYLDDVLLKIEKSKAKDSSLYIPSKEENNYRPFQRAGIDLALDFLSEFNSCMFADEMGLGKTIEAIGVLNYYSWTSVLILCPKSLVLNWRKELEEWHYLSPSIEIVKSGSHIIDPLSQVIICPYSLVTKLTVVRQLSSKRFQVLILDEIHKLKNWKTGRTCKAVFGRLGKALKKRPYIMKHQKKVIALSGTPIVNYPHEFYSVLSNLAPRVIDYASYESYIVKYCGAFLTEYGWACNGSSNEQEFYTRLRSKFMIRRLKEDVLAELPDKIKQIVYFEPTAGAENLLKTEIEFSKKKLRGEKVPFEEVTKTRHELAKIKAPFVADHLEELLESGVDKIVVFFRHKIMNQMLSERLHGYNICRIMGNTRNRQDEVDRFQNDKRFRLFFGEFEAAGTGHTLTAASMVVFAECDWVPSTVNQAIDRCHRIGQTRGVLAQFLIFDRSLDANMVKKIIDKQDVIDDVIDREEKQNG